MTAHSGPQWLQTKTLETKVVILADYYAPGFRAGGAIRSLATILEDLPENVTLRLITRDRDLGDASPYAGVPLGRWVRSNRAVIWYQPRWSIQTAMLLLRSIRTNPPDLYYLNSLFSPWFSLLPLILMITHVLPRRPILLAPRGELNPGALALKRPKKWVALQGLRPVLNHFNLVWHASSSEERKQIYEYSGSTASVIVISDRSSVIARMPRQRRKDTSVSAVFLSRIAPKKNLASVLRALLYVREDLILNIFGSAETKDAEYWATCRRLIASVPGHIQVRVHAAVAPADVADVFAEADVFVFPTLGENFGHVIAESLAVGCPVICTKATPWTREIVDGGGWIVEPRDERGIATILDEIAVLSPEAMLRRRLSAYNSYLTYAKSTGRTSQSDLFDLARSTAASATSYRQPPRSRSKRCSS